jgi:hypothetical protein
MLARGLNARIKRGAPEASLDMIDTPSETAVCSVGGTGRPPGTPGLPGGAGGDEPAVQAAANTIEGTVSLLIRTMIDFSWLRARSECRGTRRISRMIVYLRQQSYESDLDTPEYQGVGRHARESCLTAGVE